MAVYRQFQAAVHLTVAHYIKPPPIRRGVHSPDPIVLTKAEADIIQALQSINCVGIVAVGQNTAGAEHSKLAEGFFHIRKILEIVQMIRFNIQDHGQ